MLASTDNFSLFSSSAGLTQTIPRHSYPKIQWNLLKNNLIWLIREFLMITFLSLLLSSNYLHANNTCLSISLSMSSLKTANLLVVFWRTGSNIHSISWTSAFISWSFYHWKERRRNGNLLNEFKFIGVSNLSVQGNSTVKKYFLLQAT